MGRPAGPTRDTKRLICERALEVFAEKGYVVLIEEPAKAAKSAAEKKPEQGEDKQPEGEAATGESAAEVKTPKRTLRRTTTTTTAATPEA